jgi:hypothetical protein
VKSAPPSHKSVIDFTMSRSTISMTFLIINPINRLNDILPYGIYYHYCDKCPTFAHYQSLITFVALPKYHRVALTKAPMNSCHWMVSIHLPWSWSYQYASITLQWRVLICAPKRKRLFSKRKRLFPSASDCFPSHISVTAFTVSIFPKPLYKQSFGLRVTMIWYAPPIAYRLVANSHFEVFFAP